MNSTIILNDSKFGNVIDYDDIARLTNKPLSFETNDTWSQSYKGYYFFFNSELSIPPTSDRNTYRELKNTQLRHCIRYNGKFFDYITKKEYKTLEEWAADNGKTLDTICYGRADIHFRATESPTKSVWWHKKPFIHYVTLADLMKFLTRSDNSAQIVCEDEGMSIQEVNIPTNDKLDDILRQIDALRVSVNTLRTV